MKTGSWLVGLLAGISLTALAEEPALFRGDLRHSGVYAGKAPTLGKVKWKFRTEGPVLSSPVVSGGAVYFGSGDHFLYSVGLTGKLRWKLETGGAVHGSPAVVDGAVYVVSRDGALRAVDAASGQLRWSFATGGERRFTAPGIHGLQPAGEQMPDPTDLLLSSPAVSEGAVYFGSGDGHVYAVDAKTGKQRWKLKTGDVVHASPALAGGVLFIGSWDSWFYALDAKSGKPVWKLKTGEDPKIHNQVGIQGSAAVADGVVFFGCRDNFLYAVDSKSGRLKWKFPNNGSWVIASPAVTGGRVFFTTSDSKKFHALEAATGKVAFSLDTEMFSFSSPAVVGTTAYFGTFAGQLHAVDLEKGQYVGELRTDAAKANGAAAPAPEKNPALFAGPTLDGMILNQRQRFQLGAFVSSPSVADGVLYVGSADGHLYAVE